MFEDSIKIFKGEHVVHLTESLAHIKRWGSTLYSLAGLRDGKTWISTFYLFAAG